MTDDDAFVQRVDDAMEPHLMRGDSHAASRAAIREIARKIAPELTRENERLRAERDLARRLVNRLPLCQDHRDKFSPEQCQACRAEQAERRAAELEAAVEESNRLRDGWLAVAARMEERLVRIVPHGDVCDPNEPEQWYAQLDARLKKTR